MAGAADTQALGVRFIVLLGAPGSGKGTQAERLAEVLGVPWISTGEILRSAVAGGSELGQRVAAILDSGGLVDDETMAAVVRERLARDDAVRGFLLDGYPRNVKQAEVFEEILAELGRDIDRVLFIQVPEEELVRRAQARGRGADDREEVIARRLALYREKTQPLVEHYQELGILERINGHQTIEAVTREILGKVAGSS